jgi:hypothetical protein
MNQRLPLAHCPSCSTGGAGNPNGSHNVAVADKPDAALNRGCAFQAQKAQGRPHRLPAYPGNALVGLLKSTAERALSIATLALPS